MNCVSCKITKLLLSFVYEVMRIETCGRLVLALMFKKKKEKKQV